MKGSSRIAIKHESYLDIKIALCAKGQVGHTRGEGVPVALRSFGPA